MFPIPIVQGSEYKGYPLEKDVTYRQDILDRHLRFTEEKLRKHDNVLMLHLDLNLPKQDGLPKKTQRLFRFNDKLNQYFKSQDLDPRYLWVQEREQNADHSHYHYVVWLDGDKPQNIDAHIKQVKYLWSNRFGVSPDTRGLVRHSNVDDNGQPPNNGVTLNRNADDYEANKTACFRQASSIAKTRGKGNFHGNRSFGSSEVTRRS